MADAELLLRHLIDEVVDRRTYNSFKVKVQGVNSGGANYTSALYLATVSAPKCDDLKLFAKVGTIKGALRSKMNADRMYSTEIFFYTKLAKTYQDLEEKYCVPREERFIFPKFYGCNANYGEETVVLENLVASGFHTFDRFASMDWEHAAASIEALAKFHAFSFAYSKENPEEFQKIVEEKKFKPIERDDNLLEIWKNMIQGAMQVTDEAYKQRVVKFLEKESLKFADYHQPIGKAVLGHGDYRLSNVMFKKQGTKLVAVPVDYQTVHSACPVSDLIYFIFMGSDREFRGQYYTQLVDHYHDQLTLALRRFHMDADDVYSKQVFDSELRKMLPYALLLGVAILPVVTVEAESAPKIDGEEAELSQFVVKPNKLYAERFNGIVADLAELGIL